MNLGKNLTTTKQHAQQENILNVSRKNSVQLSASILLYISEPGNQSNCQCLRSVVVVVVFIASLPFGKHIHIYYSTLTDYITSYPWTTLHIYIRMMGCKCNKFMRFMYILIS